MKEFFFAPRSIYYRTNEFQSGRQTLVFVHGLSGSSSAWLKYEKELEGTFNILSFDLRGHGKSAKPHAYKEYQMEKFAEDLDELVKHIHLEKFVLISHSLGYFIALAYLMKHQDKVSKVVFLSPSFSVGKMLSAKIIKPFLSMGLPLLKYLPFSSRPRGHVDYSLYPNSGDWNIPRMIADIGNTSLRVYLYSTRQTYDFNGDDFLGKVYIPTLVMHGEKDTVFPVQYGALVASKINGAKLIILKNADHILVLNKREELLKEIKNFVLDSN